MMRGGNFLRWLLIATALFAVAIVQAQFRDSSDLSGMKDYLRSGNSTYGLGMKPLGILDPSRMSFSSSVNMSYMSVGGQGIMRNLYMETIGYRFSAPVTLTLNLGYMHQPYSSYGSEGMFQQGSFVGGAALDWRPKDNMLFHLEIANYPDSWRYGYSPYDYFTPRYSPMPLPPSDQQPRTTTDKLEQ